MINSANELQRIFRGSALEKSEVVETTIPETHELAFAIAIEVMELEQSWAIAREALQQTQRWPVLTTCWASRDDNFAARVRDENLYSRFPFRQDSDGKDVSPRAIIQRSREIDVNHFLDALAEEREEEEEEEEEEAGEFIHHELAATQASEEARFDWFEPEHAFLVLLPTSSSWETLAYMHWFGASNYDTEHFIALGKSWEERFGAELVAHYQTMLQCLVSRPPSDLDAAWILAREHDLAAPCTCGLSGTSLRHYANGLVKYNRWFLHERP